ncbi:MAG TPA: DUF711 family protein, partial [Pyrinomonadaceae bacterium]|nr:DUF711 family protein [Pyrinomonadaceae bacterium]
IACFSGDYLFHAAGHQPVRGTERHMQVITPEARRFRIRTITAGVSLESTSDLRTVAAAAEFLQRARKKFETAGYEIQTVRIATQPLPEYLKGKTRTEALADLRKIDELVAAKNAIISIGPVINDDRYDPEFASWASELVKQTKTINFSVAVASERGVHRQTATSAAEAIVAISKTSPGGEGNFRFTAAANCLAGTPFFPVAYHRGPAAFSIGLESPGLLAEAFAQAKDIDDGKTRLKALLESELTPIQALALEIARDERRDYLGIDTSPAPSKDASIGAAIEALTHTPFGSASTLAACAAITDVLKSLKIRTCGYSGLMLPVLEDPVLATRAAEGRYTVRELLLYSSVCGTGLDVVPLGGETSATELAALIRDVAALSVKLHKPLSARLFLIPGKKAGDRAEFSNPFLTGSVVMKLD